MLSPRRSAAIETVLASEEAPEAGLRLAAGQPTEEGTGIAMALVEAPQPEDEVVKTTGGAGVFIEPEAAQLLATRCSTPRSTITFSVRPQGLNGAGPA